MSSNNENIPTSSQPEPRTEIKEEIQPIVMPQYLPMEQEGQRRTLAESRLNVERLEAIMNGRQPEPYQFFNA